MYKKAIYTLRSNERLTPAVWRMTLEGDTQWITAPGQFVNVELDGCYLRRPISVCNCDERTITLIYKVVGEGTALMAGLRPGVRLDLLTGLGTGFDVTYREPGIGGHEWPFWTAWLDCALEWNAPGAMRPTTAGGDYTALTSLRAPGKPIPMTGEDPSNL